MNAAELKALQIPLGVLVIVLGLGAGIIYQLDQMLTAGKREFAQQQVQMREARTRLQRSGDEKELIVRYLPNYEYLQKIGFVGDEQRLNWLEGLRIANQEARLFGVQYQIGSQQTYPYAQELNPGQLTMHQSVMKLSFQLLHEGDLMNFLRLLATQSAGFFSVNECKLNRIAAGTIRFQPNISAECEVSWITLRPPTTGDRK